METEAKTSYDLQINHRTFYFCDGNEPEQLRARRDGGVFTRSHFSEIQKHLFTRNSKVEKSNVLGRRPRKPRSNYAQSILIYPKLFFHAKQQGRKIKYLGASRRRPLPVQYLTVNIFKFSHLLFSDRGSRGAITRPPRRRCVYAFPLQ